MAHLAELRARGLMLRAAGDQLLVEPRTLLTGELRAVIRAEKPSILRELGADLCSPSVCSRRAEPESSSSY